MPNHLTQISPKKAQILTHDIRWQIMELLSKDELLYAKRISEILEISEQKVHYHLTQLRDAGLLIPIGVQSIKRGRAKLFKPVARQFILSLASLATPNSETAFERVISKNFCQHGQLSGKIIVGSAEPHGKYDAISRDGYLIGELCWYLGNHLPLQKEGISLSQIITDVDYEKIKTDHKNNLILIGGHITNTLTAHYNKFLKKKFDIQFIENKIVSGNEEFSSPTHGLISLFRNPQDPEYKVMILAGVRSLGTQAAIFCITSDFCDSLSNKHEFATILQGKSRDGIRVNKVTKILSKILD
ncbi:MAG: ArsR/SmtB family transcription factor [Candidatus Hodarchaeales archaeon]|jgi:DNA-binding transcriptional ArsR family regulator